MRRSNSNAAPHAIASSRPSHRPRRPAIRAAIGHAPAAVISLSLSIAPAVFQARPAGRCLSATHSRLVPRLVLSRLEGRLVSISACLSMPYSLSRSVGLFSSGLTRLRLIAPALNMTSPSSPSSSSYISIVSLYPYIFYIYRIHHIHYIHSSTRHDELRHNSQVARRSASRPATSNRINGTRQERQPKGARNRRRRAKWGWAPHGFTPRSHMMIGSRRKRR